MPITPDIDMLAFDDKQRFVKIGKVLVDQESEHAILATWWPNPVTEGDPITMSTEWLPKSQLRLDEKGNIWMADWLYQKKEKLIRQ